MLFVVLKQPRGRRCNSDDDVILIECFVLYCAYLNFLSVIGFPSGLLYGPKRERVRDHFQSELRN